MECKATGCAYKMNVHVLGSQFVCLYCMCMLRVKTIGKTLCVYPDCKQTIKVVPPKDQCPTCWQWFYPIEIDWHVAGCKPASEVPADTLSGKLAAHATELAV